MVEKEEDGGRGPSVVGDSPTDTEEDPELPDMDMERPQSQESLLRNLVD